jgi:hypothetical protein
MHAVWRTKITGVIVLCALTACLSPAAQFRRQAELYDFEQIEGPLLIVQNGTFIDGKPIHIYLDGDGTPALPGGRIALDPSSRSRIILDLIKADETPSALVGRPCYYGTGGDCDARQWTSARYSSEVVDRMSARISAILQPFPDSPVVLVGYSGGGALAMLIAPKIRHVVGLVTAAANLDTKAWTTYHGHAPLTASLNPADMAPLSGTIKQFHFFGELDGNVPAALMRPEVERQLNARMEIVAGFDHDCCWRKIWAATMNSIGEEIFAEGDRTAPVRPND